MPDPEAVSDLLAHRAMPEVAALLRARIQLITDRWNEAVERLLPDADGLTRKQISDSVPMVLEKIALALESGEPGATEVLIEVSGSHGVTRSQQHYDVNELVVEYRLLRRIVFDELLDALDGRLGGAEVRAVNMAIDTAMQRGVAAFVEHQNRQLRAAADAESKYLSFLSHDLRNNLSGVTLTLEVLMQRLEAAPAYREDVQDMASLQRSIAETIDGMDRLLQAERLRKEDVALKLAPVDLHRLVADLFAPLARRAGEKGLRLENAVPGGTSLHSDRELLALVLQNLLGNAVKYSARGTVRVFTRDDPGGILLSVSDEGPGIAPEHLDTLFLAFSRGETHGQSGVGLGLSIASHAARRLGSELKVESKLGRGSTFSLPLSRAKRGEGQ